MNHPKQFKYITEEQFNKLPKAIQTEINRLNRDLNEAEIKISQIEGKEETNTHISDNKLTPLPKNACIRFTTEKGEIEAHINKESLEIFAHKHSGKNFVVAPESTNHIVLKFL